MTWDGFPTPYNLQRQAVLRRSAGRMTFVTPRRHDAGHFRSNGHRPMLMPKGTAREMTFRTVHSGNGRLVRTGRTSRIARVTVAALVACLTPQAAWAQDGCTAGDVVRADARAMSSGQWAEMIAVFDPDARVYSIPTEKRQLTGPISARLGTHEQRVATFRSFSGPPQRVEVADMAEVGEAAVAKLRISEQGKPATFLLVAFHVRNCKIVDLWHIAREPPAQGR